MTMTRTAGTFRIAAATLTLGLLMSGGLVAGSLLGAAPAMAQTRGPVQRTIHGKVEDKGGNGIKGAVLYLRDGRTSSVKSAITDDDGSYRFVQLSQNTDYEVWAKSGALKSSTHSISSFDSKNNYDITLKIDQ